MTFIRVLIGEIQKLKRVKITWITWGIMILAAGVLNGMIWIMRNPGMAGNLGLIGQKASLSFGGASPDWNLLETTMLEMSGLGGMLLASFILAWIFGREYQLGTTKIMLVLPLRRWWFVAAKSLVALVWTGLLLVTLWLTCSVMAAIQGLTGFNASILMVNLIKAMQLWLIGWGIALPVAWIADKSRGVYAPVGYAFGTMMCASLFGNLGWGPYVPWSALGIYSGAGGKGLSLDLYSWIALGTTAVLGFGLTVRHLQKTDNTQ